MSTILSLAPQNVWKHFYSLTQIPRPSGHMEKITAFLLGFGKELGLESFVDDIHAAQQQMADYRGLRRKSRRGQPGAYFFRGGHLYGFVFSKSGSGNEL